jgi:hypothetical protein
MSFEGQRGVECHCVRAGIRDRICQENDLNLLLGKAAAAVYLLKHGREGGHQLRRI